MRWGCAHVALLLCRHAADEHYAEKVAAIVWSLESKTELVLIVLSARLAVVADSVKPWNAKAVDLEKVYRIGT